jgi:hypothetical protein
MVMLTRITCVYLFYFFIEKSSLKYRYSTTRPSASKIVRRAPPEHSNNDGIILTPPVKVATGE